MDELIMIIMKHVVYDLKMCTKDEIFQGEKRR